MAISDNKLQLEKNKRKSVLKLWVLEYSELYIFIGSGPNFNSVLNIENKVYYS